MKIAKKLAGLIFNIASLLLIAAIVLIIITNISANVSLFGSYRSFLVQSGSMEPSIMTGDIIVIKEQQEYMKSDSITFKTEDGRVVTHRIVEVIEENGEKTFVTKGD